MVIVEVSLSPPSPDASAASLLNLAGPPLAGRFSFAIGSPHARPRPGAARTKSGGWVMR